MRRSKVVIPLHCVWATYQRLPLLTAEIEERLYRCIREEAFKMGVDVLAVGGTESHIHLAVRFPATRTVAEFMKQVKGASSHRATHECLGPDSLFRWQSGYGVFAFHAGLTDRVVAYIQNQKAHHASNDLWPALEETDEEAPPKIVREDGRVAPYKARHFNASPMDASPFDDLEGTL